MSFTGLEAGGHGSANTRSDPMAGSHFTMRIEAQKVLAARLEGRDPATEKLDARRPLTTDTLAEVVALYGKLHLSQRRSGREVMQILQRNLVDRVGSRSVHSISKRDVIDLVNAVVDRGSPFAANKSLKVIKSFFNWCVGRAIVERSPCEGIRAPTIERARDRVLTDGELAEIIRAARQLGGPYGAIVEVLALTGQRRDEVARMSWDEVDLARRIWTLPAARTKNDKPHTVQLPDLAVAVIGAQARSGRLVFSRNGVARSATSLARSAGWIISVASRTGACTIRGEPWSREWPTSGWRRMSPTRSSIMFRGRSPASPPSISGMSS